MVLRSFVQCSPFTRGTCAHTTAWRSTRVRCCKVVASGIEGQRARHNPFRKVASLPMCSQLVALPRSCRTGSGTSGSLVSTSGPGRTWPHGRTGSGNLCGFESYYEGGVRFGEVCMHRLVVRPPKPFMNFQTSKHSPKVPDGDHPVDASQVTSKTYLQTD